jgi:cell division protein FtsL
MIRLSTAIAVLITLVSAFALYSVNYDSRRLEQALQSKERALELARSDIAVLRAERAYLARPERIEPVARRLDMRPVSANQYVSTADLATSSAGSDRASAR